MKKRQYPFTRSQMSSIIRKAGLHDKLKLKAYPLSTLNEWVSEFERLVPDRVKLLDNLIESKATRKSLDVVGRELARTERKLDKLRELVLITDALKLQLAQIKNEQAQAQVIDST